MHELTEEELALLADEASAERPVRRGRKPGPKRAGAPHETSAESPVESPVETHVETRIEPAVAAPISGQADEQEDDSLEERVKYREQAPAPVATRGPHTPAQYDDDGWGGLPVQMRG